MTELLLTPDMAISRRDQAKIARLVERERAEAAHARAETKRLRRCRERFVA